MKRSEAINIISNFIYELNVDADECDEESNNILTALEKAGMIPPPRTFEQAADYIIYYYPFNDVEEDFNYDELWEKEYPSQAQEKK